jgi:hypothetical protein
MEDIEFKKRASSLPDIESLYKAYLTSHAVKVLEVFISNNAKYTISIEKQSVLLSWRNGPHHYVIG